MTRPFTIRPDKSVRRGIGLIVDMLREEEMEGYDRVFPGITAKENLYIYAALEWMEQYVANDMERVYAEIRTDFV